MKHCALASIRVLQFFFLLFYQMKHPILNLWALNLFRKISLFIKKFVYCLSFILKHCALSSIRMWDMAFSHSSSLVWGWPLSDVVRLLDLYFWNWKLDSLLNCYYGIILHCDEKNPGLKQFPWIRTIFMFLDPN